MNEQLEFVKWLTERLDSAKIPYMLTGSVAMAAYAQPRMTRDLDVVVECRPGDAAAFVQLLNSDCYVDASAVREAIEAQSMFNAIHRHWIIKADFIVRKDEPYRRTEFKRRKRMEMDGVPVWIVAPEDLILSKLVWAKESHSSQQTGDVRLLVDSVKDIDWDYMRRWAAALDVEKALAEVTSA